MARGFLKAFTSKKKSSSKAEKKDSTSPKQTSAPPPSPVPLPVIGRHRSDAHAPKPQRSSITIGANRTPQPPPLTTLQKWTPGEKGGSPKTGGPVIGRGRGVTTTPSTSSTGTAPTSTAPTSTAPKPLPPGYVEFGAPVPDDDKAPYTENYSYNSTGATLFEDDKDSGPYNNVDYAKYGGTETTDTSTTGGTANYSQPGMFQLDEDEDKDSGPYNNVDYAKYGGTENTGGTANYSQPGMFQLDEDDDKDSGPYNNIDYSTQEDLDALVEDDDKDSGPYNNIKYGTQDDLDAILEADDESDYESDDDEIDYQNIVDGPEQKEQSAPEVPKSSAPKDTPAVRKHRAWLIAKLSTDYTHERTVQRSDLKGAAGELARDIKTWYWIADDLDCIDVNDPDEFKQAIAPAPKNHPIRQVGDVDTALEMAKKMHANLLEKARRQELPVTEEGDLGDISSRLVEYDDESAQERSLVLVGGNRLFRNDDKKTPVDTAMSSTFHSGLGAEIFVVGMGNDIHMASHKIGKFHHSSLLGGANVSMAGEMQVTDGKIDWLSNKSGHYHPSVVQFQQFLHHLSKDMPINFPVNGWGVPKNVTGQQLVDGVDETGQVKPKQTHDFQKMQEQLTAWKELVGKPAMKKVMKDNGWKLDKWDDEWEVEDADGNAVPPKSVREAMKRAYPHLKPVGER
ncbi:hypothetical protein ASC77_01780 [Nocardioides sp. Root1257]|uniref:hypothetical protein n=1 Tax=unclassified Nocardioides TaxID=2615069 RepID=UPI000700ABEB|nr:MULTISPECIES: hypothetical protein [unclassified Nocardioides]KQW53057.1 hypothetical protein ASC77_01780 [Nocardioides sp. Root1257]KRC55745.1 hypothetical protein ASE24_01780 [Nocardioides sp. Root224]